jgi:hypothetical protein
MEHLLHLPLLTRQHLLLLLQLALHTLLLQVAVQAVQIGVAVAVLVDT